MARLVLTEADFANLSLLDSPGLRRRLAEAVRVPSSSAPQHLVTMNSIVRCRDGATGERREVRIVYPQDARLAHGGCISVLSPLDLVLLGASVGDTVEYRSGSGRRRAHIEGVVHQPESSFREFLFVRRPAGPR